MRYDTVRAAIKAAILAGDAGTTVHDYLRLPVDTSTDSLFSLFGVLQNDGSYLINTWVFSRFGIPQSQNTQLAYGGINEIIDETETWNILCWKTLIDNPDTGNPTEYAFQKAIDSVKSQLRNNASIRALTAPGTNGSVLSIQVNEISQSYFGNERSCHYANITVTLQFLSIQA